MVTQTHHACALEINNIGILIKGSSGSGKTSLMMGLLERANQNNLEAFLISDDQIHLNLSNKTLEARVPETISGLVEIHGFGIVNHQHKETTNIALVVELVEDETIERLPEKQFFDFKTVKLPLLKVPRRHENQSIRIVFSWLIENADLQVM